MFLDYHYSSLYFISRNKPKPIHILDPVVYESSYPAIQHPLISMIFSFFHNLSNKFYWLNLNCKFYIIYLLYIIIYIFIGVCLFIFNLFVKLLKIFKLKVYICICFFINWIKFYMLNLIFFLKLNILCYSYFLFLLYIIFYFIVFLYGFWDLLY